MKDCSISVFAFLGSFIAWSTWTTSWGQPLWRFACYGIVWIFCIIAGAALAVRALRTFGSSFGQALFAVVLLLAHSFSLVLLVLLSFVVISTGGKSPGR